MLSGLSRWSWDDAVYGWFDGWHHSYYRPFLVGALSFRIPLILPSNSRTKSCKEERKIELDSCPHSSANVQLKICFFNGLRCNKVIQSDYKMAPVKKKTIFYIFRGLQSFFSFFWFCTKADRSVHLLFVWWLSWDVINWRQHKFKEYKLLGSFWKNS